MVVLDSAGVCEIPMLAAYHLAQTQQVSDCDRSGNKATGICMGGVLRMLSCVENVCVFRDVLIRHIRGGMNVHH